MKKATATLNSLTNINDVETLAESDAPMVQEIVDVLRKYNALDRFGLSLLHKHFDVTDDEVLLETTDIAARTQLIRPVPKSELEGMTYVETSWRLDTGVPMMHCVCYTEKGVHTGQHVHQKFKTTSPATNLS